MGFYSLEKWINDYQILLFLTDKEFITTEEAAQGWEPPGLSLKDSKAIIRS